MALKLFLFFSILFFSTEACFSQAIVRSLQSPDEIWVEVFEAEGFFEDKKVVILSAKSEKIIAIGSIDETDVEEKPGLVKVKIEEVVDNLLVLEGDAVELLDFNLFERKKIPGFTSLTLSGDQRIPSKYKELVYFGVFTSEGHTLDEHELLVSPFQLQYGLTDKFGVRVVNALWFDGYANVGAKYRIMRNKRAKITVNTLGAYKVQAQDWIGQFGGVITIPSNSKFQSHLMVNITFDPQYEKAHATRDLGLFTDSDIRSITEYMTDNWNRVLYGPVYNVELQTFGGTVSYMWVWNTFHASLGIATRDFSNLTFGSNGYYYVYDMFWRF